MRHTCTFGCSERGPLGPSVGTPRPSPETNSNTLRALRALHLNRRMSGVWTESARELRERCEGTNRTWYLQREALEVGGVRLHNGLHAANNGCGEKLAHASAAGRIVRRLTGQKSALRSPANKLPSLHSMQAGVRSFITSDWPDDPRGTNKARHWTTAHSE